jgi:hypothetical protein
MYQIKLNDRLSDSLTTGFDKSIYSVVYGEFASLAGPELFNQIFDRVKTWETPMYFGEAEIMLLKPLATRCMSQKPGLTQDMFALAGAYGILEEIARLSSTRDLAAGLSKDTIVNHPVVQQLVMMGILSNEASTLADDVISSEKGPNVNVKGNPKELMSQITQALSGAPIRSSDGKELDVITVLNALYSMGSVESNQQTLGQILSDLQQTMKMGKRYPMSEMERQHYFDTLINPVLNWLASTASQLFNGEIALDDSTYTKWADFMIVARWFSFYLDCVEKYDEVFPTQLIPSQSQMQVMEIARAANRFKGIYLKLTQSSMTSALSWSFYLWDQMYDFFLPFMTQTSALNDLHVLVDHLKADYDKVKDPWAHSMVMATFERMKTLSGVDVLLDKHMSNAAYIPGALHDMVSKKSDALEPIPTGSQTLSYIGKYSRIIKISPESRNAILTTLSNIASSFNSSVSAMMQATQFITRDFKLPILESVLPDKDFSFSYPAQPLSLIPVRANFSRIDTTVRTYAPWIIKDNAIQWINLDKINTLVRAKAIQDSMVENSPSTIYWPELPPIQVGEPYLAMMAKQPVMAPYTQNVTTDMLPLSWSSWFKLCATHNTDTRPENVLALAATALAQDRARNEGAIATCFAATCAIALWKDGDSEPTIMKPNIPWVYGSSFEDLLNVNAVKERVNMDHGDSIIWSVALDQELATSTDKGIWYVSSQNLDGETVHFAFALWRIMPALTDITLPEMDSIRYSINQLVKGSYFTIPCRRENFPSSKFVDLKVAPKSTVDLSAFESRDMEVVIKDPQRAGHWVAVRGICPVVLTLPHLTWDLATPASDALSANQDIITSMYSFINIPVKWKFNDYDRTISFMAQYNNPVMLMEYQDFENDATRSAILPSQASSVSDSHPDLTTDKGHEAPAGEDKGATPVSTLSAPDGVSNSENATLRNPLFKVETDSESISQPSTASQPGIDNYNDQVRKAVDKKSIPVPKVVVDPATHAEMKFTPAQTPKTTGVSEISPDKDVFAGDPTKGESALGAEPDRDNSKERDSRRTTATAELKKKKKNCANPSLNDSMEMGDDAKDGSGV